MIVGAEVNAFWELHAFILVDSPELAVVRLLALALADGSIEVVPGEHQIGYKKTSHA